jgi:hypothetical protein
MLVQLVFFMGWRQLRFRQKRCKEKTNKNPSKTLLVFVVWEL